MGITDSFRTHNTITSGGTPEVVRDRKSSNWVGSLPFERTDLTKKMQEMHSIRPIGTYGKLWRRLVFQPISHLLSTAFYKDGGSGMTEMIDPRSTLFPPVFHRAHWTQSISRILSYTQVKGSVLLIKESWFDTCGGKNVSHTHHQASEQKLCPNTNWKSLLPSKPLNMGVMIDRKLN